MDLATKPAAQYIRMSTDTQSLSPAMQRQEIEQYARRFGFTIVRSYEDEARSGLTLRNRTAMRQLLEDVSAVDCAFSAVLVYDVSRWGRFQDTDESAYYEYHCRAHGVDVIYVVEQFDGKPTPTTALLKTLKRSMAAEFSRELAAKVTQAQHTAVSWGFQIGRTPCIGVSRVGVTATGEKRHLHVAERPRKGERLSWVIGPIDEVTLVRRIFTEYAGTDVTMARLAAKLNSEGNSARGKPFTLTMVRCLLESEIFYGEFIWGRRKSGPRAQRRCDDDPAVVRHANAMEPIVSRQLWDEVQAKRDRTRHVFRRDRQQMLGSLKSALERTPGLSALEIRANNCAPLGRYYQEFGPLRDLMRLAGRDEAAADEEYLRRKSRSHRLANQFRRDLGDLLTAAGLRWSSQGKDQLFTVHDDFTLRFRLIWRRAHKLGPRWYLTKLPAAYCSHMLLVLMEEDETARTLLLMSAAQYRGMRSWFLNSNTPGAHVISSSLDLVRVVRELSLPREDPLKGATL